YSCLLKTEQDLNICYIFMGNSYLPLIKMSDLLNNLNRLEILSKIVIETETNNNLTLPTRIELSKLIDYNLISHDAING
ncbi:MAG: hypothetical protein ACTSO3_11025, partial [Candidatus Heimdallarchaeaceae archaeon]